MAADVKSLFSSLRTLGLFSAGIFLGKDLIYKAGGKFFEMEKLPVKVNYVDWWPKTCQKVTEVVSKFWSRRVEGVAATSISSTALTLAYLYSDDHPLASSIWNMAARTTSVLFDLFGFKKTFDTSLLTLLLMPSLIGTGTNIGLALHDLIAKYFDKDRALETKPIFNETLQTELDEILSTACQAREDNSFLPNLLLYGPPGTGKTMISKWIAKHSGLNYILISAGDLLKPVENNSGLPSNQTNAGAAVATLQKIFEHAKNLSSPTVIFIDEVESIVGKRDTTKSQELVSMLNAFLELTGQASSKLMLVLATNRADSIDPAVLSRMDYKIHVPAPETPQRKSIIESYIPILLSNPEDREVFTSSVIGHIAKQTVGFSGRDLFKLLLRLKVEVRQKRPLTDSRIDDVIKKFIKQEHQIATLDTNKNSLDKNPFYPPVAPKSVVAPVA